MQTRAGPVHAVSVFVHYELCSCLFRGSYSSGVLLPLWLSTLVLSFLSSHTNSLMETSHLCVSRCHSCTLHNVWLWVVELFLSDLGGSFCSHWEQMAEEGTDS